MKMLALNIGWARQQLRKEKSKKFLLWSALIFGGAVVGRYTAPSYQEDNQGAGRAPAVATDNASVEFSSASRGKDLLKTTDVIQGSTALTAVAPGRIVLTSVSAGKGQERIMLFESPEITTLYSQFRQAKSNVNRTQRNFLRTKDMYENQAATGKDLNDSENDFTNAKASLAEFEVKLRTAGFNPTDLEKISPETVWIISDVPEAQIQEVDLGEEVKIVLSAFPNEVFHGRAEAKGDALDPISRTIKVRVSLPNSRRRLLPGMFAKVDYGLLHNAAVVVPTTALVTVEDKDYVFVDEGSGRFVKRQVHTQPGGATDVVVMDGLKVGEKVVTSGTMLLKGLLFSY